MPSLLETFSLLWTGRNWGPLRPACQQLSPSQLSNTCFIFIRVGGDSLWWVQSHLGQLQKEKQNNYIIVLGKVLTSTMRGHASYVASLFSHEWKLISNLPPRPALLQVFRRLQCASWQWALQLRDSSQVFHICCINKFIHLTFSKAFF